MFKFSYFSFIAVNSKMFSHILGRGHMIGIPLGLYRCHVTGTIACNGFRSTWY